MQPVQPTSGPAHKTREAWLDAAIDQLRPRFGDLTYPLPEKIHISVGFSFGSVAENKIIGGTTLATFVSRDKINHVFISPALSDPAEVLGVLCHELVHVALDNADGHTGRFKEIATLLGLTGKMTHALPGDDLAWELFTMAAAIGDYPHGAVDLTALADAVLNPDRTKVPASERRAPAARPTSGPARQTNRYLRLICPHTPDQGGAYLLRITRSQLDRGAPSCGICHAPMQEG